MENLNTMTPDSIQAKGEGIDELQKQFDYWRKEHDKWYGRTLHKPTEFGLKKWVVSCFGFLLFFLLILTSSCNPSKKIESKSKIVYPKDSTIILMGAHYQPIDTSQCQLQNKTQ